MIAIMDYGMGNLRSVQKGFEKVGHAACVTNDKKKIEDAHAVVLPGVGAFREAMRNLEEAGLADIIRSTIQKGKPFMGICVGLQLLFTKGLEFGECAGLGILPGCVVPFERAPSLFDAGLKIPHMGWNQARLCKDSPYLESGQEGRYFYFVHSYYAIPEDDSIVLSKTHYGVEFVSAIERDNLLAMQFHPEKSQEEGLAILKKFGDRARR